MYFYGFLRNADCKLALPVQFLNLNTVFNGNLEDCGVDPAPIKLANPRRSTSAEKLWLFFLKKFSIVVHCALTRSSLMLALLESRRLIS